MTGDCLAAGRCGPFGGDIRGCWLPFLSFPSFTALFTLIAGIMVHPRPVLSQRARETLEKLVSEGGYDVKN